MAKMKTWKKVLLGVAGVGAAAAGYVAWRHDTYRGYVITVYKIEDEDREYDWAWEARPLRSFFGMNSQKTTGRDAARSEAEAKLMAREWVDYAESPSNYVPPIPGA